jgi:uncharacterized protein YkwD
MKPSPCTLLFAVALFGALASCSSHSPPVSRLPVSSPFGSQAAFSDQVFSEVNSYRLSKGKPALHRHAGLDRLAQQHCDYLVKSGGGFGLYGKNVSHIGFEGRTLAAKRNYRITSLGENVVASSDKSPKHLVNLWARSKRHEHNMRSDWECAGVATAFTADGQVISTQIFGSSPSSSHRDMMNRFSRR